MPRVTKESVDEMLKDFDFEKEYKRQKEERDKELNDPKNKEFFEEIRKNHAAAAKAYKEEQKKKRAAIKKKLNR